LLGAVEPLGVVVLLGVGVVLPGWQGFALAMVPEVPLGVEVDEPVDPVVELPVPLFEVEDVEGVLLAVVEVPALPLLEGVHGATVVEVPVWFCVVPCVPPVTDPALPATPDVPWVDVP
jgi:hypothetical protein